MENKAGPTKTPKAPPLSLRADRVSEPGTAGGDET